MRKLLMLGIMFLVGIILVGCEAEETSTSKEREVRKGTYDYLVEKEPAEHMTNSKTRETINFWIETWNNPEQLAYVYLQNAEGKMIGYYALDGPPVSMCASLTPNYDTYHSSNGGYTIAPAPSIDGVYRSAEDCSRYYGKDATTGSYVEFTVGMGIKMLLYTEPLTNQPNVQNLSPQ